jgi:ATP-binding cassette subfamily C (CFTR/MRP) protein 4
VFKFLFYVLGTVALVGWVNPWSLIAAALAAAAMIFARNRFAQCLRDLRRMEGTTRSPVYSHLTSSIYGIKVIRSYRAEGTCLDSFRNHLDINNRANYLIIIVSRWAGLRFDWIACGFFSLIILPAMIIRVVGGSFSAADIGITFSYGFNLVSLLQWAIR